MGSVSIKASPRDWVVRGEGLAGNDGEGPEEVRGAGLSTSAGGPPGETPAPEESAPARVELREHAVRSAEPAALEEPAQPAPAGGASTLSRTFTASEEYVKLVEEAQALLTNSSPRIL